MEIFRRTERGHARLAARGGKVHRRHDAGLTRSDPVAMFELAAALRLAEKHDPRIQRNPPV
jgi:hypothetical protein